MAMEFPPFAPVRNSVALLYTANSSPRNPIPHKEDTAVKLLVSITQMRIGIEGQGQKILGMKAPECPLL